VGCRGRRGPLCDRCRTSIAPAPAGRPIAGVARVLAPWAYEGPARALVLDLKLEGRRPTAAPLVAAMCREVGRRGLGAEAVTWVPGRRRDARRRGFDHAEVLARGVACRLGLPAAGLLRQASVRRDQAGLTAAQRRLNLAGAFDGRRFERPVVLVDDLVTTGATAAACAAALRGAGVPSVEVLAPCRA
jgi:predicted amidophosphoribosyltransferase